MKNEKVWKKKHISIIFQEIEVVNTKTRKHFFAKEQLRQTLIRILAFISYRSNTEVLDILDSYIDCTYEKDESVIDIKEKVEYINKDNV